MRQPTPPGTGLIEPRLYPSSAIHGRVAHDIGRRIVSGEIAEGALLPREEALSGHYGVSRQAIREALKVLAAKGLLASRRRAGTRVEPRSRWNLLDPDILAWHAPGDLSPLVFADLVELRRLVEPAAAALAATRGDRRHVERVGAALAAMRECVHDLDAWSAADVAFHMAILAASGNTLIERLGALIEPLLAPSLRLQNAVGGGLDEATGQHAVVWEAIARGDAVLARTAMEGILELATSEIATANRLGRAAAAS